MDTPGAGMVGSPGRVFRKEPVVPHGLPDVFVGAVRAKFWRGVSTALTVICTLMPEVPVVPTFLQVPSDVVTLTRLE